MLVYNYFFALEILIYREFTTKKFHINRNIPIFCNFQTAKLREEGTFNVMQIEKFERNVVEHRSIVFQRRNMFSAEKRMNEKK